MAMPLVFGCVPHSILFDRTHLWVSIYWYISNRSPERPVQFIEIVPCVGRYSIWRNRFLLCLCVKTKFYKVEFFISAMWCVAWRAGVESASFWNRRPSQLTAGRPKWMWQCSSAHVSKSREKAKKGLNQSVSCACCVIPLPVGPIYSCMKLYNTYSPLLTFVDVAQINALKGSLNTALKKGRTALYNIVKWIRYENRNRVHLVVVHKSNVIFGMNCYWRNGLCTQKKRDRRNQTTKWHEWKIKVHASFVWIYFFSCLFFYQMENHNDRPQFGRKYEYSLRQ